MPKDGFGTEIEVGQRAAWPQRHGSQIEMVRGVVTNVEEGRVTIAQPGRRMEKNDGQWGWVDYTRFRWTECLDHVTVVKPENV